MTRRPLSFPEIALIAATRGMLGAGIGLLVADQLGERRRRTVGWTLLGIGLLSTIPILRHVLSKTPIHALPREASAAPATR